MKESTPAAVLLRRARVSAGLTQAELARRGGITQSVVSAYESGHREPSFSTLSRLLRAAGFDAEVVLTPRGESRLQRLVSRHRDELASTLRGMGATNPRVFGSTARGDDGDDSDVDLLVDLDGTVSLFGLAAMRREASRILGVDVDIVPADSLKPEVRRAADRDAVPL